MPANGATFTTKTNALRRRRLRHWVIVWTVVVGPPLVGGAVFVSPMLRVHSVQVTGLHRLSAAAVLAAAKVPNGASLVTLDTDAVRQRVGSLTAVRSVTITRKWPHGVVVQVVERRPLVAVAQASGVEMYDEAGVDLGSAAVPPAGAIVLHVDPAGDRGELVPVGFRIARGLPADIRARVRDIAVHSVHDVRLVLSGGVTVSWGGADRIAAKVGVLRALLAHPGRHFDVRAPGNAASS